MNETRSSKKDKNQHIQVFVRVRPTNNAERSSKSSTVVEVPSNKELIVRERPQDKLSKKFTFDKVFGPSSKQLDVYYAVVSPLLEEVLAGYNCTVFAYGQTGTGKTFTMEGVSNDPALHWQSDTSAGIIPRTLSHLFDELRTLDAQEYTVRVSFLELYNEELFDLLSPNDDASKIRLYEDASKKGAVIIHGLEEVTVHNKGEVYKILEKGSEKRQTAATLMNAHSSRSHTVFSITVHIKENTVDGEELLKTGKLNLVDLAGSENVGRSGAVDRRAREAGNINQSLLTLGRVITSLVERAPHIPYRESKLTRILQESLGGRTKTSIIATVSPASINLEETLSTLDYAYRAKNITNRPEINQKLSKKALLKEYTEEIERLRRDLLATRERNGVYLAQDNYNEMQATIEFQEKEIKEKMNHMKALEETMQQKEELFSSLQTQYIAQSNMLFETNNVLANTQEVLKSTKDQLAETEQEREEQKHLVEKHATTEKILSTQARKLLGVADSASTDTYKLHDKIGRKKQVEEDNESLGQQFRGEMGQRIESIEHDISDYSQNLIQFCMNVKMELGSQMAIQNTAIDTTINHICKDLVSEQSVVTSSLTKNANNSLQMFEAVEVMDFVLHSTFPTNMGETKKYQAWIGTYLQEVTALSEHEGEQLRKLSVMLAPKIDELTKNQVEEKLHALREDATQKLEQMKIFVEQSMNQICNSLLMDRDCLCNNVSKLKKNLQETQKTQQKILNDKKMFKKRMEEVWNEFNALYESDVKGHEDIEQTLNQASAISDTLDNEVVAFYSKNVEKEKRCSELVKFDIEAVQSNLINGINENIAIAQTTAQRGQALVEQLQTGLGTSCNVWAEHRNNVQSITSQLRLRAEEDKTITLSSVQELHKIVMDASVNHEEYMEDHRSKTKKSNFELQRKLETQGMEAAEWNNRLTTQLHTTHHQVDKFLAEDLRRDTPTGCTPVRREYHYPRQLAATSPHERIIQRFRAARRLSSYDNENGDVTMNGDVTLTEDVSSSILKNPSPRFGAISPTPNGNHHQTSTPNTDLKNKPSTGQHQSPSLMIKAASTSDISIITNQSLDLTVQSEPEVYLKNENKENGEDEFVKPESMRSKRVSRLKPISRRVLGTYN